MTQQAGINAERGSLIPNRTVKQASDLSEGLNPERHIMIENRRQDVISLY